MEICSKVLFTTRSKCLRSHPKENLQNSAYFQKIVLVLYQQFSKILNIRILQLGIGTESIYTYTEKN